MAINSQVLAIDIETKDPLLHKGYGPGTMRKDGFITSIGISDGEETMAFRPDDPRVAELLARDCTKVFHNGVYDLDWLIHGMGYKVNGRWEDTMTRASLLDERFDSYDLDHCCRREKIEGKNYDMTVQKWWEETGHKGKAIEHMDEVPFEVQAEYVKQDALATWRLYIKQQPKLIAEGLVPSNDTEVAQLPFIMAMRKNGLRIDTKRRDETAMKLIVRLNELTDAFEAEYGGTNLNSNPQLQELFDKLGLDTGVRTDGGAMSFEAAALKNMEHPIGKKISDIKKLETVIRGVLMGKLVTHVVNGEYLHCVMKPTQREKGGTMTGRYSSSDPNLQNISAREDKFGDEVRPLFIPPEGHLLFAFDYSQVEYRIFAHYATGPGSGEVRRAINEGADYHNLAQQILGWEGKQLRKVVKTFNFGIIYGMGKKKFAKDYRENFIELARKEGLSVQEYVDKVFTEYHAKLPFVRPSFNEITKEGMRTGFVRSLCGRKHRLESPELAYRLVSHKIQGSAAEVLKEATRKSWEAGVWNVLKPGITVHDEILGYIPICKEGFEAARELKHIMETAVEMSVKLGVSGDIGKNWYDSSEEEAEKWYKEYGLI